MVSASIAQWENLRIVADDDLQLAAKRLGVPLWGRLLIWGLSILVVGVCVALGYGLFRFQEVDRKVSDVSGNLIKIRDSIHVLANKTPDADLINKLLSQARKDGDVSVAKKLGPVEDQLRKLDNTQQAIKKQVEQQQSLARIDSPERILAIIRGEIGIAQRGPYAPLPMTQLVDYKRAVTALPPSAMGYWETVAAIINYQSLLNQLAGIAPDPAKVSGRCLGLTNDDRMRSSGNTISQVPISNCLVDLDTQTFSQVTFRNSVIRYHGGGVSLQDVRFINCRFILDFQPEAKPPAQERLVLAILNSPDQQSILAP
jgi:hypothetical protein